MIILGIVVVMILGYVAVVVMILGNVAVVVIILGFVVVMIIIPSGDARGGNGGARS